MSEAMTYAYAVVPADRRLPEIRGIAGSPVRLVEAAGIAAVVSTVDSTQFDEQGLRANFEDLRWLEHTAREHNRVIDEVAASTPVAPLSMATVYYTDERLRAVLVERAAAFTGLLAEISGRTEWGVKVYADLDALAGGDRAAEESASRPGSAYLQRLRRRHQGRDQAREQAESRAEQVHEVLAARARSSRVHPPQSRELAGYDGVMVLNGAYLVDDSAVSEFTAVARGLVADGEGLHLELTGPWPPYSFATLREEQR